MDLELRAVTPDEVPLFLRTEANGFGSHVDDDDMPWLSTLVEADRTLGVFDAGRLVGTAGAFTLELTVPGNRSVPMAGVSWVSVQPTHRRRGLLRQMMRRQLDDIHAGGEPLAGLTASESLIYGRFGYGQASTAQMTRIDTRNAAFTHDVADDGRITMLDGTAAAKVVPDLHERIRRRQNGDNTRSQAWWTAFFGDSKAFRGDRSARFTALHESSRGEPDGYVTWRTREEGNEGRELWVENLRALEPDTEAALWRFVLDIDLITSVVGDWRAPDDPLRWRLLDPRRLKVTEESDMLWLRLVDVTAGLQARSYTGEGELVIDLLDEFCPWNTGRWLLAAGATGEATCTPAKRRRADLSLTARDLGAAYLGGSAFSLLARAGRVTEHTRGALRRADVLFSAERLPWCTTEF